MKVRMSSFSVVSLFWRSALTTGLLMVSTLSISVSVRAEKSSKEKKNPLSHSAPAPVVSEPPTREELILQGRPVFSYSQWLSDYEPQMDLNPYFPADLHKAPAVDRVALEKEWVKALPKFQALRASQERQDSLQRGEIEKAEVRSRLEQLLRLSLLRLRLIEGSQLPVWLNSEGQVWETALFGIAYDEATKTGLNASVDLRGQIWRELLHKTRTRNDLPREELKRHAERLQLAWPVDRIIVAEARRQLSPAAQQIANGIGVELQKNPQRSVKSLRQRLRGGELRELSALEDLWTEADIARMRDEQKQIQELRGLPQK